MVLVTGGTGLVGAHLLLRLIEKGEKVRAIYRTPQTLDKIGSYFDFYQKNDLLEQIEWVQGDILDITSLETAFEDIEYVYHCAAFISYDPRDEEKIRKCNIEGTANVVNFCIAKKIKKLCFVSSVAALGDVNASGNSITEETEWNPEKPHSDYAISKYGAEMEVWRGQQEGLSVIVVNPGLIFGPYIENITEGSAALYHRIKKGLSFYTSGLAGCVVVDDVVAIMIQLMESQIQNQRFTLVEDNYKIKSIFDAISTAFSIKTHRIYADATLMDILWRIDWLLTKILNKKRFMSRATAKASYSQNLFSNQKITQALDYKFSNVETYILTQAIVPKVVRDSHE